MKSVDWEEPRSTGNVYVGRSFTAIAIAACFGSTSSGPLRIVGNCAGVNRGAGGGVKESKVGGASDTEEGELFLSTW